MKQKRMSKVLASILAAAMAVSMMAASVSSAMTDGAGAAYQALLAEETAITDLTTNYQSNPIGVEKDNVRFSWKMESNVVGQEQVSYRIQMHKGSPDGELVWDTGVVESDLSSGIQYDGDELALETRYYWTVTVTDVHGHQESQTAYFQTGCDWSGVDWIYAENQRSYNNVNGEENQQHPAPYFRTKQALKGEVASATLYITSLGIYDAYINGQEVMAKDKDGNTVNDLFNPGWTDYTSVLNYQGYDVTDYLKGSDEITFGVQLGSGWFAGGIEALCDFENLIGNKLSLLTKMIITYEDGTQQVIDSNTSDWKSFDDGPLIDNDYFNGVIYDARKASVVDGWNTASFDDSSWDGVAAFDAAGKVGTLVASSEAAVHVEDEKIYPVAEDSFKYSEIHLSKEEGGTSELPKGEVVQNPVDVTKPIEIKKGETLILNIGQNLAGYNVMTVSGPEGTQVDVRQAEMLNDGKINPNSTKGGSDGPKGTLYWAGLTDGGQFRQTLNDKPFADRYYLAGTGEEVLKPQYTFHGYQFVEITATEDITLHSIYAESLTSVGEELGFITTNNASINKLFENSKWSQKANYLSIPTDCPNRAERMGWTADAQIFANTAMYHYDVTSFLENYSNIMDTFAKNNDDSYGFYAPAMKGKGFIGGTTDTGWSDAGVIIPYLLYQKTGDVSFINNYYDQMDAYMDMFYATKENYKTSLGDWVGFEKSNKNYLGACYKAYCAQMMSDMAAAIGNQEMVEKYDKHVEEDRAYAKSVLRDNTLSTQTELMWAFTLGLYDSEEERVELYDRLQTNIANEGQSIRPTAAENTISVGFLGINVVLPSVTLAGGADQAYDLLLQDVYPSWLNQVDIGATSMWEQWDAYSAEYSFKDSGMNSFNHYSYGVVSEWLYQYMVGITNDAPGYKSIILQPTIDTGVQYNSKERINDVQGSYDSYYGVIESNWTSEEGALTSYEAVVPANTTATLYLPVSEEAAMRFKNIDGVTFAGMEEHNGQMTAKLLVQAGGYTFTVENGTLTATVDEGYVSEATADKGILRSVLAYAEAQYASDEFDKVIASVQESFTAALENARAVDAELNAEQAEVDSAWQSLMTEIHKLGFIRGDKTSLGKLIEVANGYAENIERYTEATTAVFTPALEAAKAVYSDGDAMQGEVSEAENALLGAMEQLRYKADKSILEEVLAEANKVNTDNYTAESVAAFNAAKEAADVVYGNDNATQQEADAAAAALKEAMSGLKAVETQSIVTPEVEGDKTVTTAGGNAKTGETAPIAAAAMLAIVACAGFAVSRKRK